MITIKTVNIADLEASLGESVEVVTGLSTPGSGIGILEKIAGYTLAGACFATGARLVQASESTAIGAAKAASSFIKNKWSKVKGAVEENETKKAKTK